jgi:serine/threonine protein kinase
VPDDPSPPADPALQPTALSAPHLASTEIAPGSGAPPGAAPPLLQPGTVVDDQFRIERLLGRGGMGAVYLARDLQLDRDVAVKLGNVVSVSALTRVEREAVALAKLQHPNVVVIHQVGKYDGRLYLAMEYVAGGNAREWLAGKPRSWREIVRLYAQAGDGLAAAHAAGFVHRDFKPDNVLVGDDGRPRVADFGLVRASGESIDPALETSITSTSPSLGPMTQTGTVLGTPAYMPPEQFEGQAADARTDQFALCASLWEALFGKRAFGGTTPAEIKDSIEHARFDLPESRGVPRRLVWALRRGLDADRAKRWPSLAPLLAELRRDPAHRRRQLALGGAVAVVVGLAVVVPLAARDRDPCSAGTSLIAHDWNASRAAEIAAAFDRDHLGASWASLHPIVDRYAAAWAGGHRAACRATRVDGSQSEALLDQRVLCLERARAQLATTLDAFITSRATRSDAANVLDSLADLDQCAAVTELAQQSPLPQDPVLRAHVTAAAQLVDRAHEAAFFETRDPAALADAALAAARATGWPPLVAQALWAHAAVVPSRDTAQQEFRDAIAAALAAGDDRTAAWALADSAWALADGPRPADSEPWLELARAMSTRLGAPADLDNRIEGADAERLMAIGDPKAALAAIRRANALDERAYPDNQVDRATGHFNLARALAGADQLAAAQTEIDAAIAIATVAAGASHPTLAHDLELAAWIAQRRGDIAKAIDDQRRTLAIDEAWYRADDTRLAEPLHNAGELLALAGQLDEAHRDLERSLALDPTQGAAIGLALVEAEAGHHARAIEIGTAELDRIERAQGAANATHTPLLLTLGVSHRELGHLDESTRYLQRAVELDTAAMGGEAPATINAQIELSYTLVAAGRAPAALHLLEPAFAVAELPPPELAELHAAFGKALWATGDHARGHREVQLGRDRYAALGDAAAGETTQADAWLHAHVP